SLRGGEGLAPVLGLGHQDLVASRTGLVDAEVDCVVVRPDHVESAVGSREGLGELVVVAATSPRDREGAQRAGRAEQSPGAEALAVVVGVRLVDVRGSWRELGPRHVYAVAEGTADVIVH